MISARCLWIGSSVVVTGSSVVVGMESGVDDGVSDNINDNEVIIRGRGNDVMGEGMVVIVGEMAMIDDDNDCALPQPS